ncbi:universal stress protein [Novipirellula sp. SH528]|uniref:universal stress protein n=1 Tax=Novipirellula sp. SH528 TaxID=3454466 RepID=UPI003F9FE943
MRVLLANDSSQHSKAAADYLLSLPFREPIDLEIVSAVVPPMMIDSGTMLMPTDLGLFIDEECEAAKERVEQTAAELSGPVHSLHTHVPVGSPTTELLKVAQDSDSDLIVLGAVGHSGLERVLLGSISDYVATHSETSTLIVRPQRDSSTPPALRKIVIALSGRPQDQRMIDWLGQFNWDASIEVHLVRVLQVSSFYRQDIRQKATEFWTKYLKNAHEHMLGMETAVQQMGLDTEIHLVEGDHIGETLVDYADEHGVDLMMIGDSDSGLLTRVFLGSTSRYVLRHSHCSVLIVRDKHDHRVAKQEAAAKAHATTS